MTARDQHRRARRPSIALALAMLTWFSCAWFGSWELNPNNATRLFAAIALVEQGDARIDRFAALTIDRAQFDGHAYLDKAPGMTLMAVPAVALADAVTGDRADDHAPSAVDPGFVRYLRLRLRIAVAIGPALLTALAAAALFDLAWALTGSAAAALFAGLGYALGTPIWGWSTTIFGHAPVAALYLLALWAIRRAGERDSTRAAAAAGLALGCAVTVEYQAALAGGVLALFALWNWGLRWRLGVAAVLGGVIGVAPLLGYNVFAFGAPFRLGYSGVVGFDGMHQGLFGLTLPSPGVLWEVVFGTRRGLLWVAPVLMLVPLGLFHLARARPTRALGLAAAAGAAAVLLVNAAYVYWDGGNATGPRLAMPAVGLLALGLAHYWARIAAAADRWVATGVLTLSIAINLAIAAGDIFTPPFERWPLRWIVTHRLANGDITSVASDWWGWPGWTGVVVWALVALPTIIWLIAAARLRDAGLRIRLFGSA